MTGGNRTSKSAVAVRTRPCAILVGVEIEILVVPDCPHSAPAADRARQALARVGLSGASVTTRVITDQDEAERAGFTGSPTFLVDGRDPFAEPGRTPGLTCRMYRTADGLSGLPDLDR